MGDLVLNDLLFLYLFTSLYFYALIMGHA